MAQLIGLAVAISYSPKIVSISLESGETINKTTYDLPFGLNPPSEVNVGASLISIIIALFIAVMLMLLLMKIKAEFLLRAWFFFVIILALSISINAFLPSRSFSSLLAVAIAVPFAVLKVFKRNIIIHNLTELLIYPGIAVIFIPILSIWTAVLLFVLISIYDIYAVWHSGFMQKMAKYQIKKVKVFSGFFVPYIGKKERKLIEAMRGKSKKSISKKIKISVALLGGGDIVFPIILAGVVLNTLGLAQALIISLGATLALAYLLYISEKGKFYPAMPFISAGCFIALGIAYLI